MAQQDFRPEATPNMTITILAILFLIFIAVVVWSPLQSSSSLLDNSYVAVLPFDRIGSDKEQDNRKDRMNEDIIKDLSKINGVFVKRLLPQDQEKWRSRHLYNFSYKGQLGHVKQIAEDVGVRYILTGKVHKYRDNLRVSTRLIDAVTGDLLWMNRYIDSMGDFASLKNAIADKIATDTAMVLDSSNEKCIGTSC